MSSGDVNALRELARAMDLVAELNHDMNPRTVDRECEAALQEFATSLRRVQAATEQLLRHVRWCRGES